MPAAETIIIRRADVTDLPAFLRLYAELETGAAEMLSPAEAERIFARMAAYPDYAVYIAELDGAIVGTYALLIMDNLAHAGAPSGVVEDVVVSPACQGQGIGRAMMQAAMEHCRQTGCYKLTLSSNLQRTGAHAFYRSLGFKQHGLSFWIKL